MTKLPDFIHVDRNNLHFEAEKHARLTMRWTLKLADATEAVVDAENELDRTKARLEKDIRKRPTKYGLKGEVREAAIKSAIILCPEYQEALKLYNKAQSEQRVYKSAVESLDTKKRMIEILERLDQRGYYSVPRRIRDGR